MLFSPLESPRTLAETPIFRRRVARVAFCRNAFFWGVGNSFVSSTFVVYFLKEAAANANAAALGLATAWVVAAPRLVGLLRLATPFAIDFVGGRKRLCVGCALISPLVLSALPFGEKLLTRLAASDANAAFFLIGLVWALYHLIEYFGTSALWSWIGDATAPAIRLRFFAQRERRLIAGKIVGLAGVGLYSILPSTFARWNVGAAFETVGNWKIFLPLVGIVFLSASALPLCKAPEIAWQAGRGANARRTNALRRIVAPLKSRPFATFVLFGVAIQLVLGWTQSPQYYFRTTALQFSFFASQALAAIVSVGQWSAARRAARIVSRRGAIRASFAALFLVALGFVLYAVATPSTRALLFVAAGLQIAWVVVNIAINGELTRRSDAGERSAFVAFYFAATTLAFGLATMFGGALFDRFRAAGTELTYLRAVFIGAAIFLALCPAILLVDREKTTEIDVKSNNSNKINQRLKLKQTPSRRRVDQ